MASTEYNFISAFNQRFSNPDELDQAQMVAAFGELSFKEYGAIAKQIQEGMLSAVDAASARLKLQAFSDGVNLLNERLTQSGVVPGSAQDAKFAGFLRETRNTLNLAMQQVAYAADEIAAGNSASIQRFASAAARVLEKVGAVLGMAQIGKELWDKGLTDAGIDGVGEKSMGVLFGYYGGIAAAAFAGGLAAAIGAPVILTAGLVVSAGVGLGYVASKAGESLWPPARDWGRAFLSDVFDTGSSVWTTLNTSLDDLSAQMGNFDGTWLQGLQATDAQKAALTTLLAGASRLPVSAQFNADIQRVLEAPFAGSTLVSRDALLRTIMLIAKEQGAYISERVSSGQGWVALSMPPGAPLMLTGVRDLARGLLDEFDQVGFAINGANRIVVSPGGGTLPGAAGADLLIGSNAADTLIAAQGNDELIAGAGADVLLGQEGTDALYGGQGDDRLDGGEGADYLYGGRDNDTYVFNGAFGSDWVIDSDGQGRIQVDGTFIDGSQAQRVSSGADVWVDGTWVYTRVPNGNGGFDLLLQRDSSLNTIRIRNWSNNQLGITLGDSVRPPSSSGGAITGGFIKKLQDDGVSYVLVPTGYDIEAADPSSQDFLIGSGGADRVQGGAGNDLLVGNGGDDQLEGGDGDDVIAGGTGSDTIQGGAGRDFIFGSGNGSVSRPRRVDEAPPASQGQEVARGFGWVVYDPPGASASGREELIINNGGIMPVQADGGNFIDAGAGDDRVSAGTGNDIVLGGIGNDEIDGMAGADLLVGELGNDNLSGDGVADTEYAEYTPAEQHGNDTLSGGAGNDTLTGQGADDVLYGGADDDQLFGDQLKSESGLIDDTPIQHHGRDYLDGGEGNDYLEGHGGDDTLVGGSGNDNMWGDADAARLDRAVHGADLLDGGIGNDSLSGGDKGDRLLGGEGDDAAWGGEGDDTIEGGAGNDFLSGDDQTSSTQPGVETGNDLIYGGEGNDALLGGLGDDTLQGEAGKDALHGGAGDDLLYGGADDDFLSGDDQSGSSGPGQLTGNDLLEGGDGSDQLLGGRGNDTLVGGQGADYLDGGEGDDVYIVGGSDLGETGPLETIVDVAGNNRIEIAGGQLQSLNVVNGTDLLVTVDGRSLVVKEGLVRNAFGTFVANGVASNQAGLVRSWLTERVSVSSSLAGASLLGGSNNDSLTSQTGGARLEGGAGADNLTINAQQGGNTVALQSGDGSDRVFGVATYGQAGRAENRIVFGPGLSANSVRLTQSGLYYGQPDLRLRYGSGTDEVAVNISRTALNSYSATFDRLVFDDGSQLTLQDLVARGVEVSGTWGSSLNDTLAGSSANESLAGDAGSDTYRFGRGSGRDSISESAGYANDIDTLEIGPGVQPNDMVWVRVNSDSMIGRIPSTGDQIRFFTTGNSAIEQVRFSDGTVLTTAQLPIADTASQVTPGADEVYGSAVAEAIDALAGNDTVLAGEGDDTVQGGSEDDWLEGEAGADRLFGGSGADTLLGGAGDDYLEDDGQSAFNSGSLPNATLDGGLGRDTLRIVIDPTTNAPRIDVLGAPTLADRDTLVLAGIDASRVAVRRSGTSDVELQLTIRFGYSGSIFLRNQGRADGVGAVDRVLFDANSNEQWTAGRLLQLAVTGGAGQDSLTGFASLSDEMTGGAGQDTLAGDSGNDTLDGGLGNDELRGEAGNDIYLFATSAGNDRIVDLDGTNANEVRVDAGISPSDVTLVRTGIDSSGMTRANDSLVMIHTASRSSFWIDQYFQPGSTQTAAIVFADGTVWRHAQASALAGTSVSGTANSFAGTAGDDVFAVDNPLDSVSEQAGAGNDTVRSSVSYALPNNVENLDLTGALPISATGNALNNVLRGNAGDNIFNGSYGTTWWFSQGSALPVGSDTLIGGAGDDLYYVDGVAFGPHAQGSHRQDDTVVEQASEGSDTIVYLGVSGYNGSAVLPQHVERLVGYSAGALVGNDDDNYIESIDVFDSIRVVLDGGSGADTLVSGAQPSVYVVDNSGDVVLERGIYGDGNESTNRDEVRSSVNYALGSQIEDLTLLGMAPISGTGNEKANTIDASSNSGANLLDGKLGDDLYKLDGTDTVVEAVDAGFDTVTFVNVRGVLDLNRFANVERLTIGQYFGADSAQAGLRAAGSVGVELIGNQYENVLIGGDGDDVIRDQAAGSTTPDSDVLSGGAGNDRLYSSGGNDVLDGGTGDDILLGGTVIFGAGYGHDVSLGYSHVVRLLPSLAVTQLLLSPVGTDLVISNRATNDTLTLRNAINPATSVLAGEVNIVSASDGTVLDSQAVSRWLSSGIVPIGTSGSDLLVGAQGAETFDGLSGDDMVFGLDGDDTLAGGSGDDLLHGGGGSDLLLGGDGSETFGRFVPDPGADRIIGGAGDDIYHGTNNDGADTYLFGAGWGNDIAYGLNDDTLDFDATAAHSAIAFRRTVADPNRLLVTHDQSASSITLEGFFYASVWPYTSVPPTNMLFRFSDSTVLTHAQVVNLATGMQGTSFNDNISTSNGVVELFGLGGNDTLRGAAGADLLDGGTGDDQLTGGAGDDTYVVDSIADNVIESANAGTDTVRSSISWTLGNNLENLELQGTGAINTTGNSLANQLRGNSAANVLNGAAGADAMAGGAGNDTYVVDNVGDTTVELAGEGVDTVQSSISWTLAAELENLTLTGTGAINATGNTLANVLSGNSGANRLDGGAGADTMIGGAGNDTYVVNNAGDVLTEAAAGGTDTVESSVSWALGAELEKLTLTGTSAINATGNTLNNTLNGNSANNVLDGGAGNDTMVGGAGNDTYGVDSSTDVVTEAAAGGTDTVLSSITLTLAGEVENLTLTGTSAINGTGNALANTLRGNAGNNTLSGGAGNDSLIGGAGNDTYVVDAGGDSITELAGEGVDLVQSGATYTLAANIENLTLTGNTAINGTGNTADNVIIGNGANNTLTGGAGNDTLDGGTGNDTMVGGAGNDIFVVNTSTDVVTEAAAEGTDTVRSTVAWTLGNNLENLTLLGSGAINGTGNTADNVLTGNSNNNTLTGNAGNDTLDGGAGTDTLIGGTGADCYLFGRGWGVDTVQDNDASAGITDRVLFGAGIVQADTRYTRSGNNLEVAILNTTDKLVIKDWYLGSQYQVEQFRYADGSTVANNQMAGLLSAMASFSAPAVMQTAQVNTSAVWRNPEYLVALV